jgi:hypothetical protein
MTGDILDVLGQTQRMALMSLKSGRVARSWPRTKALMTDLELAGLARWQASGAPLTGFWGLTPAGEEAATRQLKRWKEKG